jgi:large subunit ribosomal protein L25
VPTRPQLTAQKREIRGKAVKVLRRDGLLPAVVYGHGHDSESIQVEAKAFDAVRRQAGRNALVDLHLDGERATPVIVHGIQEHPVNRHTLHVDFYVVEMTEELVVDVPVVTVGQSEAAEKQGGTLLLLTNTIKLRALPDAIPQSLELDVTPLDSFEAVLHVRDLRLPDGVTLITDTDEPLARVQPPRVEEEPVVAEELEEGEEAVEGEVPEGAAAEVAEAAEGEGRAPAPAEESSEA